MRRPLCFLCLTFAVIIVVCSRFLLLFVPLPDSNYESLDRQQLIIEGKVYRKEYRSGQTPQKGAEDSYSHNVLVLYLKSVHILNQDLYQVQNQKTIPENNQIQRVICYINEENNSEPLLGSTIRISGKVKCFAEAGNPGEFDVGSYYRMLKIDFQLQNGHILASDARVNVWKEEIYRLRRYFSRVIDRVYEEKDGSIMKAMLLGEKSGLDEDTKTLYKQSSILHILSISGLHISLIGREIYRFGKRLGAPLGISALVAAFIVIGYGEMAGMGLSAVRAIIMFLLHLAADLVGRTYDMMTALALAAVFLLLEQPGYFGHSGFLFSFGAVASLCILEPVLRGQEKKKGENIKRAFSSCFAISLVTFPIHLTYYFEFPLYSVFLNMLVIPLMTIVMAAGLFCMLTGGLFLFPATVIAYIDRGILWFYEKCCIIGARIPYGIYTGGIPEKWKVFVYLLLLLVLVTAGKRQSGLWKLMWIMAALKMLLLPAPPALQITMLDVGQGDCIHIQSENGNNFLIDGGSSSRSKVTEYQILPYLKAKGIVRLEAVFITHSDTDHCSGVGVLLEEYQENRIEIGRLILPDIGKESKDEVYRELENLAEKNNIKVEYMSSGQAVRDGELTLRCMHPDAGYITENPNEYSLSLYLSFGSFTALFTGDVEGRGEAALEENLEKYRKESGEYQGNGKKGNSSRLTLLKVAHHGSEHSTGKEFLESISPHMAFISCEKKNSYGHPHAALLDRLKEAGSDIYITAESGAVTVKVDKQKCRVDTFR